MKKNVLLAEVIENLRHLCGHHEQVVLKRIGKENGTGYMGILIRKQGEIVTRVFNWDHHYLQYGNKMSAKELAERIYLDASGSTPLFQISGWVDYEEAKERIVCRLVNYEQNRGMLEQIPHERFLDLAVIFYLMVGSGEEGDLVITVTNSLFESWQVPYEEMKEQALKNCETLLPARLASIEDMIFGACMGPLFPDHLQESDGIPLYCLSNKSGVNGASVILYPGVLKKAADLLQSDLAVLPSSRHEVLLYPLGNMTQKALQTMVQDINREIVEKIDQLSDHVYVFRRAVGKLELEAA